MSSPQQVNLTLFDILGYKDWMRDQNGSLQEKIKLLKLIKQSLTKMIEMRRSNIDLLCHNYADNILLWTDDTSQKGLNYLLFMSSFILNFLLHVGIPIRAAISNGEAYFSKDDEIYTGPALVEAHESEAVQKWIGAVLCESVIKKYGTSFIKESQLIVEYEVPEQTGNNKSETRVKRHCLAWSTIKEIIPKRYHSDLCTIEDLKYLKNRSHPKDKPKYSATIDFFIKRSEVKGVES